MEKKKSQDIIMKNPVLLSLCAKKKKNKGLPSLPYLTNIWTGKEVSSSSYVIMF